MKGFAHPPTQFNSNTAKGCSVLPNPKNQLQNVTAARAREGEAGGVEFGSH